MRFSPEFLDQIRDRLPVSEVVGRRVKLRRQGREFIGLSPFNSEKTPSFTVNDQKGFYHCFSSGAHGDIFRFLMETEGLPFPEAVERLAHEAGLEMPKRDPDAERRAERRHDLSEICDLACQYFQSAYRGAAGEEARRYVEGRRLRRETVDEFRIGFAPNEREGLKGWLQRHDVPIEDSIEAGLLIRPDDGRAPYDRFRNRLIIPIQDDKGRVVAFGGRTLDPDGVPKYLNSPETPIFHKGAMLFNAHRARQPAHESGSAVVVEGYMDAIAVYQAGVKAVVASLGTAFTEDQIARLWRLAAEPVICFDGDAAGVRAAHRAVDRILPELKSGYSFNFAFLPDGQDPDDLIASGGREAFVAEVQKAMPLSDVLWERELSVARIDTPERKAALEKRFDDLIGEIRDQRVARRYRLAYRVRLSDLFWERERKQAGHPAQAELDIPRGELIGLERIVLGLCVEYPDLFESQIDRINGIEFAVDLYEQFKSELFRIAFEYDEFTAATLYQSLDQRFFFVLKEVHGDTQSGENGKPDRARGHQLRARLPILKLHPGPGYVEACMSHFLDRLEIRGLEKHLDEEISALGPNSGEAAEQMIISLSRELNRRREEYARLENQLAEEARAIRSAYGTTATPAGG